MRIKFAFFEKEIIGIGIYRILYETNIRMEDMPGVSALRDRLEEKILASFGATKEEAASDTAYSMDFIVRKKPQLGISLPGDNYMLAVTTSNTVKRMERAFTIQEDI